MDVDVTLLGFAAALRAAGVRAGPDRARSFVQAVAIVGADRPEGVYWAGRSTLCSQPDDAALYDTVFAAWFGGNARERSGTRPGPPPLERAMASLGDQTGAHEGEVDELDAVRALATESEVLRHRDIAGLSAVEMARLDALFAQLSVRLPRRSSARRLPAGRGQVDARALLRDQLRRAGELGPVRYRRRATRPRPVVLLVDISGSMSPYADALLRLGHLLVQSAHGGGGSGVRHAARARVEVFSIGTRLTRLSPVLSRFRSAPAALEAAGAVVLDWSGGTRLGEVLEAFIRSWGRRGVARGAVVVICSDGWERGETELLQEQVRQLSLLAHRVVWVNPHRGKEGYLPVQAGIAAVLPHLDDFVDGHSLAAFEELLDVIAHS